jgi:outer membrane receptor protein involved in Fe transport
VNGRTGLRALEVRIGYAASGEEAARSEVVSVDDARRVDAGVYASVDTPVGRGLSLAGGLRGDRVTSRNRGGHFGLRETDRGAVSGFASATLGPFRGLSTTVQVARGFRDPFLSDRYYRGPTGRGFITGSPDLESETSLQLDLAVRYVSGPFRSSVYAYQYRIHDLIERYETATDTFLFRNRGRARVRGVEAEAQVALPARVSLDLTGHWIRGEALDDDTPLDGIPPPTVTVRLRRDFGRAAPWVRLGAFGRLDAPGPTERERPGYALLDAGADVRLGDRAELRLLGRNLLDKAYRVSPDSRAVYAPGLAGVATVTLRF